ncbi:MAG: DUF4270 family protein [Runella slithyformis]|nr:MAG: DUF4270 family protein [Runella slithyformis]TAF29727.1 MAG: DUF4270 family protein [Runella slithyformis]TAF48547.1 MAG: DUF4270 family protein [Runella slithyformis]TAF83345.1 MAG: DUF4270 family protein [Runella slithyformis]
MSYPSGNLHWSKKTKILQKHITTFTTSWLAKFVVGALVLGVALAACEAPKEIGLPPAASVGVIYTDTLTVKVSTMLLDSVRTSGARRLLLGNYQDPTLGRVSARSFFTLYGSWIFPEGKTYEYDSVLLSVNYPYEYGDTLRPFQIAVHRLADTVQKSKTYYNNSSLPFNPTPIITKQFNLTPSTNRQLNMRLPDSFGRELFEAAKNKELDKPADLTKKLNGLVLVPGANNAAVLGLAPQSISVAVFIRETGQTTTLVRDFLLISNLNSRWFNQVTANRTGTVLNQLQPLRPVSTAQTGGSAHLQDALGVVMKIEFPYLSKILNGTDRVAINRAEFTITPTQPTSTRANTYTPFPSGLVMAETDETNRTLRNRLGTELLLPQDFATYSQSIIPQAVPYNTQFKNYNFVLTTYLQALTTGFKKNKSFLLMPINDDDLAATFGARVVPLRFDSYMSNGISQMSLAPSGGNAKLQLFYTVVK